jgi:hypothetical protein
MSFRILFVVLGLFACKSHGESFVFEEMTVPFYSPRMKIEWKAPTNGLPSSVALLKVIPATFSPTMLENLKSLAEGAALKVNSAQGTVQIYRRDEASPSLENVPDEQRAYELGTNLLFRLALPVAEITMENNTRLKAEFYETTRGYFDKAAHKLVKQKSRMRVEFQRQIGGIPWDEQNFQVQFGANEKIQALDLSWAGFEISKKSPLASPQQIIDWIKEGRARVFEIESTGQRSIRTSDIREISIRRAELRYAATTRREGTGEKTLAAVVQPYGLLDVHARLASGDPADFILICPVSSDALTSQKRTAEEFNVFTE